MPSLSPLAEGAQTLVQLGEASFAASYQIDGLLPSSSTLPSATTYPRDNAIVPEVPGPVLDLVAEGTQALAPVSEGALTLAPVAEGTQTLTPLLED